MPFKHQHGLWGFTFDPTPPGNLSAAESWFNRAGYSVSSRLVAGLVAAEQLHRTAVAVQAFIGCVGSFIADISRRNVQMVLQAREYRVQADVYCLVRARAADDTFFTRAMLTQL